MARCASGHRGVPTAFCVLGQLIRLVLRDVKVILQWVPGHIGLKGNEEADKLANAAYLNGTECDIRPCSSEVFSKFKVQCQKAWKEYFDERSKTKGIWYKSIQSEPPRIPWFVNSKISRQKLKFILRIRSGHVPSGKFAYMMKKVSTPNCEICGQIEDLLYIY